MVRKKAVPKRLGGPKTKLSDVPGQVFTNMGLSIRDAANLARSSKGLRAGVQQSGLLAPKVKNRTVAQRRVGDLMNPEDVVDEVMFDNFPAVRVDRKTTMRGRKVRNPQGLPLFPVGNLGDTLEKMAKRMARSPGLGDFRRRRSGGR